MNEIGRLSTVREHGIESQESWVYVSALILTDQFSPAVSFFSFLKWRLTLLPHRLVSED